MSEQQHSKLSLVRRVSSMGDTRDFLAGSLKFWMTGFVTPLNNLLFFPSLP